MNEIVGHKLVDWYFKDYKYVSDLIEFEGPLLVHYMHNEHHALYFHVDADNKYNRWLCFELTLNELFEYMHKSISLYDLIDKKSFQSFFTVDIDVDLNYTNHQMILGYAIPENYKPDRISFYLEPVESFYKDLFTKFDNVLYKTFLRERSIDLSIHSTESFGHTNSLSECRDFLNAIDSSNKNFNTYHFLKYFKDKISDLDKLKRQVSAFVNASQFRVANVYQNSFHISLATDLILKTQNDGVNGIDSLRAEITDKYCEEVLNKNLNDEKVIEEIRDKYDEIARKKIFEPIINLINNPKFNLTYTDKKTNTDRTFEKISQYNKNLIVPKIVKKEIEQEESEENIFYTVTLAVSKNKNIASISKKDLQAATLFSNYSTEAFQEIQKFILNKYILYFKDPIKIKHAIQEGDTYTVSFEPLNIFVKSSTVSNAYDNFLDELEKIVDLDYMAKTPQNLSNRLYFDNNVLDIEDKE